jgi:hypothetical protein
VTAKNTLSDEEFHQAALAGGASRHPETNEVPDRGYMVGGARDLSDMPFPEIKRPVDQFSLDDVRHHAREIRDRFGPAPVYQGAWKEGDSVVLDAAEKFTEKRRAVRTARKRGERAIYDVKGSKDIPTQ